MCMCISNLVRMFKLIIWRLSHKSINQSVELNPTEDVSALYGKMIASEVDNQVKYRSFEKLVAWKIT